MNNLNWGLIRSFLAVSRLGSVSAAARELAVSQPTVSREIQALESATGLNLFRRTTQGLQLTDAGQKLVDAASRMDEAADLFSRQASGLSVELEGDVRISANEIVGIYLLPPAIAAFREQHPGVHVEIVISNRVSSLSKREADIAMRMFRPTQPDLVVRRLPDMELGFYAHRDYVKKYGEPSSVEDFQNHAVIGYDESMEYIEAAAKLGYTFVRDNFALRTDHMLAQINLARAGGGIVGTHVELAKHWPELVRILGWVPLPALEYWIVCHRDVQYNSRIRELMQFLADWFSQDPYREAIL
jgi:DNA-binding transcriptional LysR family regulator